MGIKTSLENGYRLIKQGQFRIFVKTLFSYLYSNSVSYGLRRDLSIAFKNPEALIPLNIRLIRHGDVEKITSDENLQRDDPRLVRSQRALVEKDIKSCYVAATEDDDPGYMQCLIHNKDNNIIKDHFKGIFPDLSSDESLLEGAFMSPAFRGKRIMPAAMSRIAEMAKENEGIRWVLTFVSTDNIASLKGCMRSGFEPYLIRNIRYILFFRHVSFKAITPMQIGKYERDMGIRT